MNKKLFILYITCNIILIMLLEFYVLTIHYDKIIQEKDKTIEELQYNYAKEHSLQEEYHDVYERCIEGIY